jgi:hypothetical protein
MPKHTIPPITPPTIAPVSIFEAVAGVAGIEVEMFNEVEDAEIEMALMLDGVDVEDVKVEMVPVLDGVDAEDVVTIHRTTISFLSLCLPVFPARMLPCPVLTMSNSISPLRNTYPGDAHPSLSVVEA